MSMQVYIDMSLLILATIIVLVLAIQVARQP